MLWREFLPVNVATRNETVKPVRLFTYSLLNILFSPLAFIGRIFFLFVVHSKHECGTKNGKTGSVFQEFSGY
jgi:hypothetical protein